MKSIFVDTHNREIKISAVEITANKDGKNVMRFATHIANFRNFPKFHRWDCPVLISRSEYRAQSSAGFTRAIQSSCVRAINVHFVQGFTWMKSRALRELKEPISVFTLYNPIMLEIETHASGERRGSNTSVAYTAIWGIEQAIRMKNIYSVAVLEGQSDYVKAVEFYTDTPFEFSPEPEHESSAANRTWIVGKVPPDCPTEQGEYDLEVMFSGSLLECRNFLGDIPAIKNGGIEYHSADGKFLIVEKRLTNTCLVRPSQPILIGGFNPNRFDSKL